MGTYFFPCQKPPPPQMRVYPVILTVPEADTDSHEQRVYDRGYSWQSVS